MENQIIKKKRSVYVWIIIVLLILGILGSFGYLVSGLINIKTLLTASFLSNPTTNIIRLGLYLVDLLISIIYFFKLYNLKKDVIKWTHIAFAYFIFQGFSSMILTPGLLFAILMFIPWIIVTIITVIIWVTFVKHLKKQEINNIDISANVDNPIISKDENVENKKEEKKSVKLLFWIKNNKKLVVILSIIIFIVVIIPASMFFGVKIMSKVKCGDGGYLNGNSTQGYNCSYSIINPEFTDVSQCPDSKLFCNSKGREDKNGSCLSGGVDLTTRLKVDENGGFYVEEGPVTCSYCCGSDVNKDNIIKNNSNKSDPVLNINSIDINKEIVNKSVAGTFKSVDSGEIFNYTEKYSTKEWNVNTRNYNWNTVNECANLGCNFVYFADYDKNLLMFTSLDIGQDKKQGKLALFSDRDNPLIGEITKVVFYVGGDKISGFPRPNDRHVDVFYTISYKEDGVLKTTNRLEQNMCNYNDDNSICNPIIKKIGDRVFFFDGLEDVYLRSIFLFNEIIKTQMTNFKIINE